MSAAQFDEVCDAAADTGVEWLDVASGYGDGEGLRRIGRNVNGARFKVALKIGRPYVRGEPVCRVGPEGLAHELQEASQLLGRCPNALLLKDPPKDFIRSPRLTATLDEIARRVGSQPLGLATHDLDVIDSLSEAHGQRILQLEYNGIRSPACERVAAAAKRRGWTVWGFQPLAYGFLATRTADDQFDDGDFRSRLPITVRLGLAGLSNHFHRSFANFDAYSRAERALAFCLCSPSLERIVIGPKDASQLRSAVRALELALTPAFAAAASDLTRESHGFR